MRRAVTLLIIVLIGILAFELYEFVSSAIEVVKTTHHAAKSI